MHSTSNIALARARLEAADLFPTVAGLRSRILDGVELVIVSIPLLAPASTTQLIHDALDGLAHECVRGDYPAPGPAHAQTVVKDERTWRIGTQTEVAWIQDNTAPGVAITSAIPPVFDAYATVVSATRDTTRAGSESALLQMLMTHTAAQPWWLGYLDTGAHDVVFDHAWKVTLYSGWSYVLVEAGPSEAGTWRADDPWRGRLPDLLFPADRSWLVSMLWDDDWRCVGGRSALVQALLTDPNLDARTVSLDEDATPPGHQSR